MFSYKSSKDDIIRNFKGGVKKSNEEVLEFLIKEAKKNCPEKTGNLKEHIDGVIDDEHNVAFGVKKGVPYAIDVEKGTKYQEAQPFIKTALQDNQKKLEEIFKNKFSKEVK